MNTTLTFSPTILWADDDRDDLEIFRELLAAFAPDHQLIEFENGQHLLTYLQGIDQGNSPCLIVLDMNMPVLSGRETLQAIKQQPAWKDIPTVVFTTAMTPADKILCETLQTETLLKPPCYQQLQQVIQNMVAKCNVAN